MVLKIFKWLLRAWPIFIIFGLLSIHFLLIDYFCLNESSTNKTISLVTQIIGGLLILYSIDSNIGIIKEKNLITIFVEYLRECPLIKKSTVVNTIGAHIALSDTKSRISINTNPKTIEEKIEYLQMEINDLRRDLNEQSRELKEKIENESQKLSVVIEETKVSVNNIKQKIAEVSIGGIKIQLFGVILMIYGAISGYAA